MSLKDLHTACAKGDVGALEALLAGEIDVNGVLEDTTPLAVACREGNRKIAELLLAHPQIEPGKADLASRSPLYIAAANDQVDIVELLLGDKRIDVNQQNERLTTPLCVAAGKAYDKVVEVFLKNPQVDVNRKQNDGGSPLYAATQKKNLPILRALLAHPNIEVNTAKNGGWTPIHKAAFDQSEAPLAELLKHKNLDVNRRRDDQQTALDIAADNGNLKLVIRLLAHPGINAATATSKTPAVSKLLKGFAARPDDLAPLLRKEIAESDLKLTDAQLKKKVDELLEESKKRPIHDVEMGDAQEEEEHRPDPKRFKEELEIIRSINEKLLEVHLQKTAKKKR